MNYWTASTMPGPRGNVYRESFIEGRTSLRSYDYPPPPPSPPPPLPSICMLDQLHTEGLWEKLLMGEGEGGGRGSGSYHRKKSSPYRNHSIFSGRAVRSVILSILEFSLRTIEEVVHRSKNLLYSTHRNQALIINHPWLKLRNLLIYVLRTCQTCLYL